MKTSRYISQASYFLAIALTVLLAACGGGSSGSTAVTLQTINVTSASPSIATGLSSQLTATGVYSDGSSKDVSSSVTWSSGIATVAHVNSSGLVTGASVGISPVIATFGGVSGSTTQSVTAATLVSIAVTPANPSIATGQVQQFVATGTYSDNTTVDITADVTWSSSATPIATITLSGLATGASPGASTITATKGAISGFTTLTVTAATLASIAITPVNPTIGTGSANAQQFTATGTYTDLTTGDITPAVTWSSSSAVVATIDIYGRATGVAAGTTTITATLAPATPATTTLTVNATVTTAPARGGKSYPSAAPASVGGVPVAGTSFSIGGTVTGLATGNSIVLNNGGMMFTVSGNGGPSVWFSGLSNAAAYNLTISGIPPSQSCTSINGAGTVNNANVSNISVFCGPAYVGAFSHAGSLATGRYQHTATLLPGGKVLVVGGFSGVALAQFATNAELYDPATDTWSAAGNLTTGRFAHTATLLPNGNVLVVGGFNASGAPESSAELYNPSTNSWSSAGGLATARYLHTATLLNNGWVLITGGVSAAPIANSELYDPVANTWYLTGSLATARYAHTATLLSSGKVLIAGGYSSTGVQTSAELFDPALLNTTPWSTVGSMAGGRYYHTATLLPDGKVLVAGGYSSTGTLKSSELFDPASNTWSATGDLAVARYYHTATLLPDGKVLVAGGQGSSTLASTELYDPATYTWSASGKLAAGRYVHTATLLSNGKLLVVGGSGLSILASSELFW